MTQKTRRTSSPKTLFRRCESLLACPYQGYPRVTRPGPEDHAAPRGHAHVRLGSGVRKCRSRRGAGRYHRREWPTGLFIPAHLSGSGRKAQVTRDTASNPGGGGARGPRRPADRRHPHAAADHAAAEHATGDPSPWSSGLTGPQRAFPAWDGVPGYEFEGRRASRRPSPDPAVPGRSRSRGRLPPRARRPGSGTPRPSSQPMPGPPPAWDESAAPGFEFDAAPRPPTRSARACSTPITSTRRTPTPALPDAGRPPRASAPGRGAPGPGGLGRGTPARGAPVPSGSGCSARSCPSRSSATGSPSSAPRCTSAGPGCGSSSRSWP